MVCYHNVSSRIALHRIVSYIIVGIVSLVSCHVVLRRVVSRRIALYRVASFVIVSYRIVGIISYHSNRIVSFELYPIVSYRIVGL